MEVHNSAQDGPDAVIAKLAAQQDGVAAAWQLLARGVTHRQMHGRLQNRVLHRVHRGVYAVLAPAALSPRGHLIAALLAAGPGARLSHGTAAFEWQLTNRAPQRIELTLPSPRSARRHPALTLHRTNEAIHPDELTRRRGMLISTVPRVLVELAPSCSRNQLEDLITEAVHHKHFQLVAVEATIQRHAHRPGLTELKQALRYYRNYADSKSKWERAFARWLAKHPEIPPAERNTYIDSWEIDFHWPQFKLAVELDGRPWHIAVRDRGKDHRKDTALQQLGIRMMRIDEDRWDHHKNGILDDLHSFMGIE